jgi:tetratricopeptide (TPR) repeat protein
MKIQSLTIFLLLLCFLHISCKSQSDQPSSTSKTQVGDVQQTEQPPAPDYSKDLTILDLTDQLKSNPEDSSLLYKLGERYLELKATQLARESFNKALKISPDDKLFRIGLANSYGDEGNVKEAESIFTKLLAEDPKSTDVLLSWGVLNYREGVRHKDMKLLDTAKQKFDKVLQIDPKNMKAHYNLGLLMILKEDLKAALVEFETVYTLDPKQVSVLFHTARRAMQLKEWDKCTDYATKGLQMEENPDFHYFLGKAAFEKKEFDEAKKELDKYVTSGQDKSYLADARAILLELAGLKK